MLDHFHLPTPLGNAEVFYFEGTGTVAGQVWQTWNKPRGKSMIDILLGGKGGNGGNGVVGAASTAAGGGGGGSGGQTRVVMPLAMLPDRLYIALAGWSSTATLASYVTIAPRMSAGAGAPTANDVLAIANGGGNGSNGAGATGGGGGTAGALATAATMPLGWMFAQVLVGHAGTNGGNSLGGTALTLPTTGLLVTGGTGGAGLGTVNGLQGGDITGAGAFPTVTMPTQPVSTEPPRAGSSGFRPINGLLYGYGGQGGGSTHASASGAGLVGGFGGNGAPGCGGGGGGGCLTGGTAGVGGRGGPAFCIITCW